MDAKSTRKLMFSLRWKNVCFILTVVFVIIANDTGYNSGAETRINDVNGHKAYEITQVTGAWIWKKKFFVFRRVEF